jgi:hypothetical protein
VTTDLLFRQAPLTAPPVNLVFGEVGDAVEVEIVIAGAFPAFGGTVWISLVTHASIVGSFPAFGGSVQAQYISGANRPLVGKTGTSWQETSQRPAGVQHRNETPAHPRTGVDTAWQAGVPAKVGVDVSLEHTLRPAHAFVTAQKQDAARVRAGVIVIPQGDALRDRRSSRTTGFQAARRTATQHGGGWQERQRDRRPRLASAWQLAAALRVGSMAPAGCALALQRFWRGRRQEAMRPPAGTSPRPGIVTPPFDPCYLPDPHLLFADAGSADTRLLFICERHAGPPATVVVPIRRVYMVINDVSLRRVDGNIELPALAMTLSIDIDSWTWGFNATLPASALADLEPGVDGDPVELEANINGQAYRVLAEQLARERQFGSASIRVQGRGRAAVLDAPYAPVRNFGNAEARTAQQLMADVLTGNGVGLGWAIEWGLIDWLVPAGAFSHQGSYIAALNAIAGAAGGYLQPHATDAVLRVLPRYPSAPWQWGTLTPDLELPAAVTLREGIEWVEKPRYNRVFVSGTAQGVLGQVTRAGTAGDLLAPMVTDTLITHADAARQRGLAVLADTGRQAQVSLRLPVLAETGIIVPGKLVRYVDGTTTRLGLVRSTSVDVSRPEVWQTIGVETHA